MLVVLQFQSKNCRSIGLSITYCKIVTESASRAHIAKLSQYRSLEHTLQVFYTTQIFSLLLWLLRHQNVHVIEG